MSSEFLRVSPVFPVRDVRAALTHYGMLGFEVNAYGEKHAKDPIYGFVKRGSVEIHLALTPNHDPRASSSAAYVYVEDADALYDEWRAAGVAGRLDAPIDTPYRLRELVHVDPDGNLLRVGSEL
jgi:hypothetical protein